MTLTSTIRSTPKVIFSTLWRPIPFFFLGGKGTLPPPWKARSCKASPVYHLLPMIRKSYSCWLLMQDWMGVNSAVHQSAPILPHCLIFCQICFQIPTFSVIDLTNLFFSIPMSMDSQYWFAFTFKGRGVSRHRVSISLQFFFSWALQIVISTTRGHHFHKLQRWSAPLFRAGNNANWTPEA